MQTINIEFMLIQKDEINKIRKENEDLKTQLGNIYQINTLRKENEELKIRIEELQKDKDFYAKCILANK